MSSSPVSKHEKEKQKLIQEKCQTILAAMLRDEDNKYCVDCDAKGPRWASWNLGIFLCIRCAGIHRNLGVHISRVKSVNLDSWTPEQVVTLQQMGNSRARAVYEANLPDNFRRPQADSALESFIRAKYESKKYIAREWVQPPPVKVSWDAEIELEMKRKKEAKRKTNGSPASAVELPVTSLTRNRPAEVPVTSSATKELNQLEVSLPPPSKPSSAAQDLLGLDSLVSSPASTDMFGGLLLTEPLANGKPAPAITTTSTTTAINNFTKDNEEDNFFNQKAPSAAEKRTLDKNSILALYNQGSTNTVSAMQTNMFASQSFGALPPASFGQTNMMSSGMQPMNAAVNQMGMVTGAMTGAMPIASVMPGAMPSMAGPMTGLPPTMAGTMPGSMVGNPGSLPGQMAGVPGSMPAYNQLIQGSAFSSPMYSAAVQGAGVNQLAQQLNGLSFGNQVNPMIAAQATATPLVPGMMMNQAGLAVNPGVAPSNSPYNLFMSAAPTTAQQPSTTLPTNLWQ